MNMHLFSPLVFLQSVCELTHISTDAGLSEHAAVFLLSSWTGSGLHQSAGPRDRTHTAL